MSWTDIALPAVTAVAFAVHGVDLADTFLSGSLPLPIEGVGAVREIAVPGETIIVDWIITKRTNCSGVSGRVWSSPDGFSMNEPVTPTSLPVTAEPRHYQIPTAVPGEVTDDSVELRIQGWYDCPNSPREYFTLGPVFMEVEQGEGK